MKLPVALAIVVGVVGGILTWLYLGPLSALGLFVPATFMGAATYFAAGGDLPALKKSVPANVWGVIWGTITLILVGLVSGAVLTGVIVGGLTGVMILGALIPALDFVPGHVIGFAMTVGFGLLSTGASGTDFSLPTGPFTVMLISSSSAGSTAGSAASWSTRWSARVPRATRWPDSRHVPALTCTTPGRTEGPGRTRTSV